MAAKYIKNGQWWIGSDADKAALSVTKIPAGSRFFDVTDGAWYILSNDGSTWVASAGGGTGSCNVSATRAAEIDDIVADTNELELDWKNGGRLDLLIDAIKAKTDLIPADINMALRSAQMQVIATGTFTTDSNTVPADTARVEAAGYWDRCWLVPGTGTEANQPRQISSFASGVFTMMTGTTWKTAPGLVTYKIYSNPAGYQALAFGIFTTSSTTVPADSRRGEARHYFDGCQLLPLAGACSNQVRNIAYFIETTGIFTLPSGGPFTDVPGTVAYAILRDAGDEVASTDTNSALTFKSTIGNKADAAVTTVAATASTIAYVKGLLNNLATVTGYVYASGDTLKNPNAKFGDLARTLKLLLGTRWDSSGDLGTDIASILSTLGTKVVATGTFTTSSATAPVDTGRTEATGHFNGCILIPFGSTIPLQPRKIGVFTSGGTFTLEKAWTSAPGTVAYAIVPAQGSGIEIQKDIWCADSAVLNVTVPATGADLDFPNVVVAAAGAVNGLPIGAVITQVNLLLIANILDTSAAANYLKTAADQIAIKIAAGAWGTNDIPAWQCIAGSWYTLASGMGSVVIVGNTDVSSVVVGAGTYNIRSEETTRTKAIEALGASLILKDCRTGLRIFYKMP